MDKERLVRKQSLHILKASVITREKNQALSGVSESLSSDIMSATQALTKKGRWADKEAKSLGVGKVCSFADLGSNSQQKWDAFFLLYEMLEEYGTHLVEAAWNHQVYYHFLYLYLVVSEFLLNDAFSLIYWERELISKL